jgi:predicted Zn-dependent peptidase
VHELFCLAVWPDHPLSRPVAGTVENVQRFSREDLLGFVADRYRPDRIVLAAAGRLKHDDLVELAASHLGNLGGASRAAVLTAPGTAPGLHVREKGLEQAHLCLGCKGIGLLDPDRYVVQLLNLALGGSMSSRLFQEIRERRGRAYSVYSFLSAYADAGYVGVYVGTSPQWVPEVVDVSLAEIDRLCRDGLDSEELVRTRNQMKGSVLLSLETSDSRMYRLARNELYFGRDVPLAEVATAIDAVTNDDVVRVARRLFWPRRMTLTVLGNIQSAQLDASVLHG